MRLTISDGAYERETLAYLVGTLSDLFSQTGCNWFERADDDRAELTVEVPAFYADIVKGEIDDKISDIVSVSYKYDFFAKKIKPSGLSELENEILIASLIAADLEEDKRYVSRRIRADSEIAIDGLYHFRLKPLKQKWEEICSYMPDYFINSQLREFITFLLEDKSKRVLVEGNNVYDSHYRHLMRNELLGGKEEGKIIKEIILSGCGEVELSGKIPEVDEFYLKEYFGDKIILNKGYFSS